MQIELATPMPTRPCRFCLSLQGGSVWADFDVDPDGRVFAVRVSFDGFGCCDAPADIARVSARDSATLLAMVNAGVIEQSAAAILRGYFSETGDAIWTDALDRHDLR